MPLVIAIDESSRAAAIVIVEYNDLPEIAGSLDKYDISERSKETENGI